MLHHQFYQVFGEWWRSEVISRVSTEYCRTLGRHLESTDYLTHLSFARHSVQLVVYLTAISYLEITIMLIWPLKHVSHNYENTCTLYNIERIGEKILHKFRHRTSDKVECVRVIWTAFNVTHFSQQLFVIFIWFHWRKYDFQWDGSLNICNSRQRKTYYQYY